MVSVSRILINYQENPIGIEGIDQIGWSIVSDQKKVFQKSYQLQIAETKDYDLLIYDSGVVESEESAHIVIDKERFFLRSSQKYFIRVRIITNSDEMSDWKEGFFVTALLSCEEWRADFITIETEEDQDDSKGSYLRKEFVIRKEVKAAYAYVTALGLYHLYLNGKKVGEDEMTPGWTSYNKHLLYQIYDVTDYLKKEVNAVAGHIGAGWYKGSMGVARMRCHYGKQTALLCHLNP